MKNYPSHRSKIQVNKYLTIVLPSLIPILVISNFYRINAQYLDLRSLGTIIIIALFASLIATSIIWLMIKSFNKSILLSSIFIFLYSIYGSVYRFFKSTFDIVLRHRYLLLVFALLIIISAVLIIKSKNKQDHQKIQVILSVVLTCLILYNIATGLIIQTHTTRISNTTVQQNYANELKDDLKKPDIYYLVFDEMAATEIVTQYFDVDDEITKINQELTDLGFQQYFTIRSNSTSTTVEMASRLNMRLYDKKLEPITDRSYMINEIDNNKVFDIFKQYGYETAIFPGYYYLLKNSLEIPELNADLVISYDSEQSDEFQKQYVSSIVVPMLLHYTMLDPVVEKLPLIAPVSEETSDYCTNYRNLTLFGLEETPNIRQQLSGPFFYYAHFPSPHGPYVFDQNGDSPAEICKNHAVCYGEQFVFIANEMIDMINEIMSQYSADNRPIILIQSDHGFRNNIDDAWISLSDYPRENGLRMFFAVYSPSDYNLQPIPDNFNPSNTFPWIFNSLFDANIPIVSE